MPKGVDLKKETLMNTFLEVVQNSVPFSLKINKNFTKFSELIFSKTNKTVSVSTLKRLFIYIDQTAPSRYTLDLVCRTVGYKDWNDFVESQTQISDFNYKEILTCINNTGYRDLEEFIKLSTMFSYSDYQYDIILALLKVAVQRGDKEVLTHLFDLPVFDAEVNYLPPQYYFAQEMGLILRNSDIIMDLIPHYAKNAVAQRWYIERFVDEDHLHGYYGEMLTLYHLHKKTQEAQLFYHSLMCVRDIQNGVYKSDHFDYMTQFRESEPVFYIPKMRRLALLIVYFNDDKEVKQTLMDEFKHLLSTLNRFDYTYIALIFCNIVFYKEDHAIIKTALEAMELSRFKSDYNINLFRDLNMLQIFEAYVLLGDGKPREAKAKLQSFNSFYQIPYQQRMLNQHLGRINQMIEEALVK
jgi:hypothetical protein